MRHMNATCLTTATRVLMNLLKITLLYFALFQRLTCKFCDCMRNGILSDQIVLGLTDNATRKRLLQESALILTACVDGLCRCAEATSSQLRSVWCEKASAHAITSHSYGGPTKPKCKFTEKCLMKREHKNVHLLDETQSDSDSGQLLSVTGQRQQKIIKEERLINEKTVTFQTDCGASVNVIPKKYVIFFFFSFSFDNIFRLDVRHYVCMLVKRFEPQGRRFTNFYYYYYCCCCCCCCYTEHV